MKINFYSIKKPYGEFSNFSHHPIQLKGKIWPTSEHFFQSQKYVGTEYEEMVRLCPSAMESKKMGNDRNLPKRNDWEDVKVAIMKEALIAKATQHSEIKTLLLSTEDAELVEHTINDSYWGDGADGSGKNMLGKLWMEVREELKSS